jgi:hypothetical protein
MLITWLQLFVCWCLCVLAITNANLILTEEHSGAPAYGVSPYPWGDVFHYPFFQYQTGLLADEWVPMNYQEMFRFYNIRETCVALASNPDHCKGTYISNKLVGCSINEPGYIWPQDTVCPNVKGNFIRHVSTKPWPESNHLLDIIAIMRAHGLHRIHFVGDSVTGQHFAESLCSLSRSGLNFSSIDLMDLVLSDPNSGGSAAADSVTGPYFQLHLTRHDRHDRSPLEKIQAEIEQFSSTSSERVVFIVNIGLHFQSPSEIDYYHQELRRFLKMWIHIAQQNRHVVIFRETTAQHFHSENGLYSGRRFKEDYQFNLREDSLVDNQVLRSDLVSSARRIKLNNSNIHDNPNTKIPDISFCRPLRTEKELKENNWRNRALNTVLNELDPKRRYIQVAKFHRITAARHDMHSLGTDCTHFCLSPILWYPLWQQIYDILVEQLPLRS